MTDLAELTTPDESAPAVQLLPERETLRNMLAVGCRFCDETFGLPPQGYRLRGVHEKKEHREQWEQAKTAKGAPAKAQSHKKAASTPRQPASQPQSHSAKPKRQSAAELCGMAVAGLGSILGRLATSEQTAFLGPMGTMLAFEAPIAGPELDALAAGTKLDRIALQRIVAVESKYEAVGPLIVAPLLVGAAAAKPEAWPQIYPLLRRCLVPMLPAMVKEMKRQQTEAQEIENQAAELVELDPAFAELFAGGSDPIDAIIARIFPIPPPASDPDTA